MTLALCIPAFNSAWSLPRLIESARAQTVPFDEIWVYDDASSDGTAEVAERLGARVVRGRINQGPSHGRNLLARTCTADWLHFHDADDLLLPRFVELCHRWMERDRSGLDPVDVVLFDYDERHESTGQPMGKVRYDAAALQADLRRYVIRHQINGINGLYRREAFWRAGGYDPDPRVGYNDDVALHIRLAFAGLRFAHEPEVAIINCRRPNSMSQGNRLRCLQAHVVVMEKAAAHPDAGPYRLEIARKLWAASGCLAADLDWASADRAARLAASLAPIEQLQPGRAFTRLCSLSPTTALRLREGGIRLFKPALRRGYPGWRLPLPSAS